MAGDAATDIVTGERHQKLVGRSREALRGLLKSQGLAYGAKPDHQSTYAQLVIRRDGAQARVWIGLNSTIWDSNGDAKSRVVTDAAAYQDLFARLDQALKTRALGAQPRKTPTPRGRGLYHRIHPRSARPCQTSSQPGPRMRRRPVLSSTGAIDEQIQPLLAGLACAGLFLATAAQADDRPELRIGVVSSVTGGASAIATGAVAAINLMEERTAADASLPFRVSFIKYDDGSDPARAVNATRKLIQEDRVHLVICCTTTPASLAVNKVIEEERVPNLSLAAAASVIEPADAHRYTFKTPLTDRLMIDHTVDYMVKQGWKQVAFMGLEDSYGEGGWVEFKQIATRKGLEIVAAERFSRGDTNFTPQALRVSQKKPDAVYFHAIPPSSALATETLRRVGYKGPVLHGAGSATPAFMAVGKKAVEGALVGTSALPVYRQLPDDHPLKPGIAAFVQAYDGKYGAGKTDMFAAQAYDTVQIPLLAYRQVVAAGKAADLTQARLALRDAIEATREYRGVNGLFSYSPTDHLGLDRRSTFLVTVKDGKFELLGE